MRKITIEFIVPDEHGDAALNGILDDFLGTGFPDAEVQIISDSTQPTVVSGEHGGCLVRAGKTPRQDGRRT